MSSTRRSSFMSIPAKLEYYPDNRPGIRRKRHGKGFTYIAPDGTRIDNRTERARLSGLGVPPAWENVWLCPLHNGHLQATGRDDRSRKQYRYHETWTEFRAQKKFAYLHEFGSGLPSLRRRILKELRNADAGDKDFAIAAVLALLDRASLRVGTQDYARENGTFGATTLKRRHMQMQHDTLRLEYTGKGGKVIRKSLRDGTLNRVLSRLDDLPGPELISWIDDGGTQRSITSGDVNDCLASHFDHDALTAKTFRTWNGTVAALNAALAAQTPTIKGMTTAASERLCNTPAICRRSYVHPAVINLHKTDQADRQHIKNQSPDIAGLRRAEAQLMHLLDANKS